MGEGSINSISREVYYEDDGFFLDKLSLQELITIAEQIFTLIGCEVELSGKLCIKKLISAYIRIRPFSIENDSELDIENSVYKYLLFMNFPSNVNFDRYQKYSSNLGEIIILYSIFNRHIERTSYKQSNFDLLLPEDKIISTMEFSGEFETFKYHFLRERTYELMKLNQELFGHTSYDHIIGVNSVAVNIAMQLYTKGIKIDIGIVCGAALCHDIGKYACDKNEDNVARIHYYFTDKWFEYRKLEYMRNIAVNHSTWDLELENLSIESLVLILSDFMVKKDSSTGKIKIYDLDDSFKIVMNKLENMTVDKVKRYKKVFAKLKDFEFFLESCGVEVSVDGRLILEPFISNTTVTQALKNTAIRHSIEVMHNLRSFESISKMMKQAIEMKDMEGVISRLRVIEEYCIYLTPYQKKSVLELVFDFLYNPYEHLREVATTITGKLIYHYHSGFRKWIPERERYKYKKEQYERVNLLNNLILKTQGLYGIISDSKYELLCSSVGSVIGNVGSLCVEKTSGFIEEDDKSIVSYIERLIEGKQEDKRTSLIRIEILSHTVMSRTFIDISISRLILIIRSINISGLSDLKSRALYLLKEGIVNSHTFNIPYEDLKKLEFELDEDDQLSSYLFILIKNIVLSEGYEVKNNIISDLKGKSRSIFLNNLKSTTSKTDKLVNIEILEELSYFLADFDLIYLSLHLINILRTNDDKAIRDKAGRTLCSLIERLDIEMINDIVVELFKSFESDDYEFVSKIAYYLGYISTFLTTDEYIELFKIQKQNIKTGSTKKKMLILDSILSILTNSAEREILADSVLLQNSMKIILIGLTDDVDAVRHHSFKILNLGVFQNPFLNMAQKVKIFKAYGKKLSGLILDLYKFDNFKSVNLSGDFNLLYRFIINCEYLELDLKFIESNKVAIYSGAFDPISKGQKNVIKRLVQMGYQVDLQINEFIWNRSVQPYEHRKRMIELTIAEYNNVFLIPAKKSFNLGVKSEIFRLKKEYESKELYILIGEDDLINNTVYTFGDNAIDSISHIIIGRGNTKVSDRSAIDQRLMTMESYESINMTDDESTLISPMSIRSGVDRKYDLNDYLDQRAARYIRKHDLYIREPNLKGDAASKSLSFILKESNDMKTLLITGRLDNSLIGQFNYTLLNDKAFRTMKITRIDVKQDYNSNTSYMITLSELILSAVNLYVHELVILKDCCIDDELEKHLRVIGFKEKASGYVLKINKLMVVILDFHINLKIGPLTSNKFVNKGINEFRENLLIELSQMLSGRTVVFVSKEQIEGHLLDILESKDKDGNMVLGISEVFKKGLVPNFTTKNFNIAEVYNLDSSFVSLDAEDDYLSIDDQIEIISRFYMDVYMLTDYLGAYGNTQEIISSMSDADIKVKEIITFLSSSYVEELLRKVNISMDSAYHLLDDTIIIRESSLMPFAGGIPIKDKNHGVSQQNIYNIYPYCERRPFDIDEMGFLRFSFKILKEIVALYGIIEKEHEKNSGKRLLVSELNKVFNQIRYPYINTFMSFNDDFSIIDFLDEEIRKLKKNNSY